MQNKQLVLATALIAVVMLGAGFWWLNQKPLVIPEPPNSVPVSTATDTTTVIEQDLNAVDLGNLDAEFQTIDQDLNTLK